MQSTHAIRQSMRQQRLKLAETSQQKAEARLLSHARQCRPLWNTNQIMSYAPFEGEISPRLLVKQLTSASHFLPRIANYRRCRMQIYSANSINTFNRFGIAEPAPVGTPRHPNQLDLILLPLVAFDRAGNRLGMGAGYYDRALQALRHQTSSRPLLIGLAHSFQELDHIAPQPWDIPVDAILTDQEYIPISSALKR